MMPDPASSFVYFIRPVGLQGPIKIGCSSNPKLRRMNLDAWSPFELEIVAQISGDRYVEERFHAKFAKDWHRLEWFHWSEELQAVIDAINAGTFDPASLPRPSGPIVSLAARKGKWSDLDHDYYVLWRRYCERGVNVWPSFAVKNGVAFAAMNPAKKQAEFDKLADFLATLSPRTASAA